jgi:activator of 2-hydroxyglutaryl-CoA dehydratase
MKCSLGLDLGSVNAKLALINEAGQIIHVDVEKIVSNPRRAVNALIGRLGEKYLLDEINSAGVSGSGKTVVSKELGWPEYSSSLAIAAGLLHCHPDVKTIVQIGGQSSRY